MTKEISNINLNELAPQSTKEKKSLVPLNLDLVGHMSVNVSANIGTVDISITELFSLKAGEVLQLNESLNTPITLLVDGIAIARGNLIAVNDHFGIQITEMANA